MAEKNFRVEVINLKEVQDYIETMPEESFEPAKEEFQKAALSAANVVKQMKKMKVRTGALKKSIQQSVTGKDFDTLQASVYSAQGSGARQVVYAPIQEFGGTVKAKKAYKGVPGGPYLNIPVGVNLTPAGVMRKSAWTVFQEGGHIRGHAVFLGDDIMFALVKSVKLKPRLEMVRSAEDEIPTLLSNLADVIGAEG